MAVFTGMVIGMDINMDIDSDRARDLDRHETLGD
jgi:hypothetical protein